MGLLLTELTNDCSAATLAGSPMECLRGCLSRITARKLVADEKNCVSASSTALDLPVLFLGMKMPGTSSTLRFGNTNSGLPPTLGVSGAAVDEEEGFCCCCGSC